MPLPGRTLTRGSTVIGAVTAVVLGILLVFWTQGGATTHDRWESPTAQSSDRAGEASPGSTVDPESGLPVIRLSELPVEARKTVARIDAGGPFPYEEDGGVFENREELLPDRPEGHYREYTVGGRRGDRGPLRIVAGEDLDYYWTEDHYQSFSLVVR